MTNPWIIQRTAWLEYACRILLGLVFLLFGLDKIPRPDVFARAIANYRILPAEFVNLLAVVLPWIECICGFLLLSGQWVRSAALVVGCLLVLFIGAVGVSLARGLDIHCGCFNAGSGRRIGLRLLAEDVLLLAMSVFLVFKAADRTGWAALVGKQRVRR